MSESHVIIGIHGLANKPPEAQLKDWWQQSLVEGLKRNESRDIENVALDLVYWREWGYTKPLDNEENDEPYTKAEGNGPLPRYKERFWDTLRSEASDLLDTPLDWVKQTFGFDAIADKVLEAKLKDLGRYYGDQDKREFLRNKFRDAVCKHRGKRIMVIAHSMGSIIAYDVLRKLGRDDPNIKVDHFVTIGSPLGLPHVKYKIMKESHLTRTPSIARRWTNLSDRRDPVAADTHLAGDYAPNDRGVQVVDDLILNSYLSPKNDTNFHKSYGYLRSPELSKLVLGFI